MEHFLQLTHAGFQARMDELRPAVAEFKRLERQCKALQDFDSRSPKRRQFPSEVRLAQVLDLLNGVGVALRRKDIAAELGLTEARVGRLANQLIAQGLLEQTAEGLQLTKRARNMARGRHPETPILRVKTSFHEVGERDV